MARLDAQQREEIRRAAEAHRVDLDYKDVLALLADLAAAETERDQQRERAEKFEREVGDEDDEGAGE